MQVSTGFCLLLAAFHVGVVALPGKQAFLPIRSAKKL